MHDDHYEWDERKNSENKKKHGISFEVASEIFQGPILTKIDDREDYGEERSISLGQTAQTVILVVAHTDRHGRTRIISTRKATRSEKEVYYENLEKIHEGIHAAIESGKGEES